MAKEHIRIDLDIYSLLVDYYQWIPGIMPVSPNRFLNLNPLYSKIIIEIDPDISRLKGLLYDYYEEED